MNATPDTLSFFTARARTYARMIRVFRYGQGLRACFMKSALLRSGIRVLDAGCGTGAVTLALHSAMSARGLTLGGLHAFDLTPAMLDVLRESLRLRDVHDIDLAQANVLSLDELPVSWRNYDLIVSASMLEYIPRDQFTSALSGLRALLSDDGSLLLFITRDNWLMRPLIGKWWQSNLYTAEQLQDAFRAARFSHTRFHRFPLAAWHLALWGHIVEARR